jgi:hypothetical protein
MRPTWQTSHKPLLYIKNNSGDVVKPHNAKGINIMIISNIEYMTALDSSNDIIGGGRPRPKAFASAYAESQANGPKAYTSTFTNTYAGAGQAFSQSSSTASIGLPFPSATPIEG